MDTLVFAIAQLNPTIGDIGGNLAKLKSARQEAAGLGADVVVAPECYLSGYQIDDLVLVDGFLDNVMRAVEDLAGLTADGGPAVIVGAPRGHGDHIHNSVFVLEEGRITATRDKVKLAIGGVFDDPRNFAPGPMPGPAMVRGVRVGLPICEDMWSADVTECLQESGAEMLVVVNGSPFEAGKVDRRMAVAVARVSESGLPLMYVNLVGGVDDAVFDGSSFCLNRGGEVGAWLPSFSESLTIVEAKRGGGGWAFTGPVVKPDGGESALWRAITLGIRDYAGKTGFERVILGLSGGVDSALVATLAVDALGAGNVDAVMMPSPHTSDISIEDAGALAGNLGVKLRRVDIDGAMETMDRTLAPALGSGLGGVAAENMQSRLRGLALMGISNTEGQLLLTTGNKSEYASGYATLYGDMCGGYAPLLDLWKTEVFSLCRWRNANQPQGALGPGGAVIPERIITRPPSAELRPGQKDSDTLPGYDQLDPVMRALVEDSASPEGLVADGHDGEVVRLCARMLQFGEYKRQQGAPGPKLSPRAFYRDRRMPITNRYPFGGGGSAGRKKNAGGKKGASGKKNAGGGKGAGGGKSR